MLVKFSSLGNNRGTGKVGHEGFFARFAVDRFAGSDMSSDASAVFDPNYSWVNWCRDSTYAQANAVAGVAAPDACCSCRYT